MINTRQLILITSALVTLGLTNQALAVSGNWTSLTGGDWNTASNWSSNPAVPGTSAGDAVNLNADFTATTIINLNTDATVGSMIFGDVTASGNGVTLSGPSSLTFNNSGAGATLAFQGSNTTNFIDATIQLADNLTITGTVGPSFRGAISANSPGIKTISANATAVTFTNTSVISDGTGSVALTKGNGQLTLNGNNSFSGGVTGARGTINLGHANALGTGTLTLTADSSSNNLNVTDGLTFANNMVLANAQSLAGTGNLTWSGNITNSGGSRTINRTGLTDISGNVYLSESSATGRTLTFGGSNNGSGTISGVVSNYDGAGGVAGSLAKTGTGTLVLTGANTYTGETRVGSNGGGDGGTIQLSGAGKLGAGTATVYSGTLDLNGTTQTVSAIALANGISGAPSANILIGSGTLNLDGSQNGSVSFSANTNNVGATISGVGGGILNLNRNRNFLINDSTNASVDLTVSAIIANGDITARNVSKTGTGTMEFSGANTYTGTTSVSAGTLLITGNATAATGTITVSALATLAGNGTIGGAVTVSNNGIVAAGTPQSSIATLTINNRDLTVSGIDSKLYFDINGLTSGQFDRIVGIASFAQSGDITFAINGTYGEASWDVLDFVSQTASFDTVSLTGTYIGSLSRSGEIWSGTVGGQDWAFSELSGVLSVVPEPSIWGLIAIALTFFTIFRRRRYTEW